MFDSIIDHFFCPSITSRRCVMNMYIFCKITKKIWFGGFNADNYEETIISFFFPLMHTGPVIFIQNIMNVALNIGLHI